MNRIKRFFTIIELLVVISVIAILMGILIPTIGNIRQNAKKTKAKAEINAIVTAIKQYEQTYGVLPWGGGSDVQWEDQSSEDDEYDTLMQILTQTNMTSGDATNRKTYGNVRKISMLDVPKDFETKGYLDPWGTNRYVIALDLNYDNQVSVNGETLNGTVFVYSKGPDKIDSSTASNSANDDNINSWK